MNAAAELIINDDHPLALELTSLRVAVARFQHEAHSSALKLQRHSLESALAVERAHALERENTAIREELTILRSHPDVTPHPATLQVTDLTHALRRLSDKLTQTEDTLVLRTKELANALADVARGKLEVEGAYALAAHTRAREEESKARERGLLWRVQAAEEERDLTDRVVKEYADLVRNIERKNSLPSTPPNGHARHPSTSTLSESLRDSKTSLRALLEETRAESEGLRAELARLHAEAENNVGVLEAERKAAESERAELSRLRVELDRVRADDDSAAKMVSRYMYFTQTTTNSLQTALENLKARHGASLATLEHQLAALQSILTAERRQADRLRTALDELTEQHAREAYGRRREVLLRLAVIGREDGMAEAMRRWVRRAKETLNRTPIDSARQGFTAVVDDAEQLLCLIDGVDVYPSSVAKEGLGGVARILAAENAVKTLVEELQIETEKRMRLERLLGRAEMDENGEMVSAPPPTAIHDTKNAVRPASATPQFIVGMQGEIIAESRKDRPPSLSLQPGADSVDPTLPIPASTVQSQHSIATMASTPSPRSPPDTGTEAELASDSSPHSPSTHVPTGPPSFPSSIPAVDDTSVTSETEEPLASSVNSPPPSDISHPPTPPLIALLADLATAKTRYDALQRAYRDCHLALRDLTQTLSYLTPSTNRSILQAAVQRLTDFNEDARVELEIRVVDEERVRRGYETLLTVPGAIASPEDAADVLAAVRAFVDGSEAGVARALARFEHKLEDLQHDTASVKRAVHEFPLTALADAPQEPEASQGGSWSSLAAGFFTSSRPSSPAPQTFGAVMTSPRLRRATSGTRLATDAHAAAGASPFATLGLRVPMPEHVPGMATMIERPNPRPRTMSGVYMLGLGMRSASFVGTSQGSPGRAVSHG
ncbi:hypothetical protein K488DRAFT_36646, partial [Vararia minispora EC-137]